MHEVNDTTMEMVGLLEGESERGCVLVAAAYLEETIRRVLSAYCRSVSDVSDKDLNKLFKTFDSQFANFSSCIRLVRAFGLIQNEGQQMLLDFAVWRNDYAHGTGDKLITPTGIAKFIQPWKEDLDRAANRSQGLFKDHSRERRQFEFWAAFLVGDLHLTIGELESISGQPRSLDATDQ